MRGGVGPGRSLYQGTPGPPAFADPQFDSQTKPGQYGEIMMERPRSLTVWGRGPRPGPTWRTAVGFGLVVLILALLLEGWWILTVPGPLRARPPAVEIP